MINGSRYIRNVSFIGFERNVDGVGESRRQGLGPKFALVAVVIFGFNSAQNIQDARHNAATFGQNRSDL